MPKPRDNAPRVYTQREDIDALRPWVSAERQQFKAVAYEWTGEDVFHLFAKKPAHRPQGTALAGFVWFVDNVFELQKTRLLLENGLYHQLCQEGGGERFIVAFFALNHAAVDRRVFLCEGKTIDECRCDDIPARDALYSRHRGLLEVDTLAQKRIGIIGLGSFGSIIAVELAKAGVGAFSLFDPDRLELSNIVRHACGVSDLGRLKIHAVADAIRQKNPYAQIEGFPIDVNRETNTLKGVATRCDLLICVTDENTSRFTVNAVALESGVPCLFGRAITRAAGGDIFRLRPGYSACLGCLFEQGLVKGDEEVSTPEQARRDAPAYMSSEEVDAVVQVGLSADIAPLTQMMVKLALVELCRGQASALQSLEKDLAADFYIWANRREQIYGDWEPLGTRFNQPAILRWYGVKVARSEDCLTCQATPLSHVR